jgi:ankyrin repeat protein
VTLTLPPVSYAAYGGNAGQVQELLTRGASPNAKGSRGLTPLMLAASPDAPNPEVISLLLGKGAEINAQDELGRTALDWTLLRGDTSAARQLRAAGGKSLAAPTPAPAAVARPLEPAEAIKKALALLEPIGPRFFNTSGGCISCHNNTLPGMAAQKAAERKIAVNRAMLDHAPKAAMAMWRPMEENLAVGASSVPGLVANVSYELMAMAEAGYPPNSTTDAAALSMLRLQRSDGSWTIADTRSPLGISDMKFTAMVARALIAYLPPGLRRERDGAVDRARNYLLKTHAESTQDAAFQVLGLLWVNAGGAAVQESRARLLALQRKDGGWGQLPTMASDAYATGQALFALQATRPAADSEEYRRGVRYLLRTQLPDGSWFVQTRAIAFQPYRETGFPHGTSQFISAAATSWAVMALSPAVDVQARSATQK